MKYRAIFSDHNIAVISVFDVKQVLHQAETGVCLRKPTHNSFMRCFGSQGLKMFDQTVLIVGFDLVDRSCMLNELIEGS